MSELELLKQRYVSDGPWALQVREYVNALESENEKLRKVCEQAIYAGELQLDSDGEICDADWDRRNMIGDLSDLIEYLKQNPYRRIDVAYLVNKEKEKE